jgi:hypothetical protein
MRVCHGKTAVAYLWCATAYLLFGGIFMNNKKSIIAVIALVLVVAVFAGIYFATRPATQAAAAKRSRLLAQRAAPLFIPCAM